MSHSIGVSLLIVVATFTATMRADDTSAKGKPTTKVEQTPDAVIFKNHAGQAQLRYELNPGVHKNLTVQSACYFHPFTTPAGMVVTEVAPDDHPHHRGIFFAFVEMHGEKDADFWGWG